MKTNPLSILNSKLYISRCIQLAAKKRLAALRQAQGIACSLWLVAIFLLTAASCTKEPDRLQGTIRGRVIDKITLEPIPDVKLLFRFRNICTWGNEDFCWTILDSTSYYSDSMGRFSIDFDIEAPDLKNRPGGVPTFGIKGLKEGYFDIYAGSGEFIPSNENTTVVLWPKTYLKVRILDETRDPHLKYDGIRLRHAGALPFDSIIQRPIDTIIIITGDPFNFPSHGFNTLRWNLFYLDNPEVIGPIRTVPQVQCPPHDTCDVEIRF
jgi:hypothetical protein